MKKHFMTKTWIDDFVSLHLHVFKTLLFNIYV